MFRSRIEEKVQEILDASNVEYEHRIKGIMENKRLELDFYIPSHNLAIECHGNYWHSEIILDHMKAMKHMKEKFDQCNAQGIQLMQFYEDEIKNKPDLIKSMIQYKLGIGRKLYGRNTLVFNFKKSDLSKLDIEDIKEFFNTNHIQGISAYNSGSILLDKKTDEIVSIMLFNNITSNRGIKAQENEVELVRFCSNCIVVGGASKLLVNYLENNTNVKRVVSYSDNRISLGNLYEMLSFKKTNEINPSYYYVHKSTEGSLIRLHKTYFKKANQKIKFENYNEELTEYDNCANNDYYRLWDAGKVKWELVL